VQLLTHTSCRYLVEDTELLRLGRRIEKVANLEGPYANPPTAALDHRPEPRPHRPPRAGRWSSFWRARRQQRPNAVVRSPAWPDDRQGLVAPACVPAFLRVAGNQNTGLCAQIRWSLANGATVRRKQPNWDVTSCAASGRGQDPAPLCCGHIHSAFASEPCARWFFPTPGRNNLRHTCGHSGLEAGAY
jgi:hypothetical protein